MIEKVQQRILISGPSVSDLEISYTTDAAKNGWNKHCFDYIDRLESMMKKYLGVSYALATSSCTSALHLAFMSLNIGPGDEVIVPDSTWVATANALHYTGATPVFVDVDEKSWTIDPAQIEAAITPKTKAICVVHLYGHTSNMPRIMEIAKKYNLYVIEDAAESLGGKLSDKRSGALGDVACFSFHGSKAIVMGEGGMLVTNNEKIYKRAKFLGDQCKHPTIRFFNDEFGYKYKLSNLQAAFGTAQMERIDEILQKKRAIFHWYKEQLDCIPDIQLNGEEFDAINTYWMVTMVLGKRYSLDAKALSDRLLERNIDTRPFFYPLSTLPMLKEYKRFDTPIAHKLASRGINLPCGAAMTQDEVTYVCDHIKNILLPNEYPNCIMPNKLKEKDRLYSNLNLLKEKGILESSDPINICYGDKKIELALNLNRMDAHTLTELKAQLNGYTIYASCYGVEEKRFLVSLGFSEAYSIPVSQIHGTFCPLTAFDNADTYKYMMKI